MTKETLLETLETSSLEEKMSSLSAIQNILADETPSPDFFLKEIIDDLDFSDLYEVFEYLKNSLPPIAAIWGELEWHDFKTKSCWVDKTDFHSSYAKLPYEILHTDGKEDEEKIKAVRDFLKENFSDDVSSSIRIVKDTSLFATLFLRRDSVKTRY